MSDDHLLMCCCCRTACQHIVEEKDAEIELLRGYRDAAEADAAVARLLLDKSRLTDEEREAVAYAVSELDHWTHGSEVIEIANTLRKLLERLGGDR